MNWKKQSTLEQALVRIAYSPQVGKKRSEGQKWPLRHLNAAIGVLIQK